YDWCGVCVCFLFFFFFFYFYFAESSVLQLVGRPQLVGSPHYHLSPSLSLVTPPWRACIDSIIPSMQHPPLQRELSYAIPTLNYVFFFLLSNGCNFQCSEVQYFSQNLLKSKDQESL